MAACTCGLAFAVTPASAYTPRTYESQFSVEPGPPQQIAIDSANRIWVSEPNGFGAKLHEFNATNERLSPSVETGGSSLAIDHSNGDIYMAGNGSVGVYSAAGLQLPEKTILREGYLAIAADNSSGLTAGRLYLDRHSLGEGEPLNYVELFNENGDPVNFPRTEEPIPPPPSYLNGNKLTGTTAGHFVSPTAVAVGPNGELYVVDSHTVDEFAASGEVLFEITGAGAPGDFNPGSIAVDPTTGDLLVTSGRVVDEFSNSGVYLGQINGTGVPGEFVPVDVAVNSAGFLYVSAGSVVDVFSPSVILPKVTYPGVSKGTQTTVTLNAEVNPDHGGEIKTCKFEYVEESAYRPEAANPFAAAHTVLCSQQLPYPDTAPTQVSAEISGIVPGVTYYYRLLAGNDVGTTEALPRTFDLRPPSLTGLSSANLTETSVDLSADINPEGGDTTYHFEYGPTTSYGSSVPVPSVDIGSLESLQSVSAHLMNLEKGVVYHFRLVAENPFGTVVTEDQSFNFFPPTCPNGTVRQQTGTAFLPDCRAYELVSPPNAGSTILFPEGPQSPQATQPSRLAFGGILGEIPEAGGEPPDVRGDLYVATRTPTGWTTRFVGLPATQTLQTNGPPGQVPTIQTEPSGMLTNLSMDQFMGWRSPYNFIAHEGHGDPGSYAPYLWDSGGNLLGRLPTNLGVVPGGETRGEQLQGAVKPSPEFNHYFFSSTSALSFAPESLSREPGSAYDDNLEENTVELISKLPNGEPIEEGGGEYITFPGVSTDGSHILMSTGYTCNFGCDPNYDFAGRVTAAGKSVNAERHLFMRVGGGTGGITYPIALSHAVHYVGMTAAGSKVFFTSNEKLTDEAEDTSTNLYMWSEARAKHEEQPLTLISKPNGASGTGTPVCPPVTWTTECGAVPYISAPSMFLPGSILEAGPGGNGLSDNAIAAENGDIYFYSPQQLDGAKGGLGQRNLYDYRDGKVQYVTTFDTGPFCGFTCGEGPLVRIQVSPDGTHMAFLTASQITSYDNAGYLEMYAYDSVTGDIHCVSCLSAGDPPTSNVEASQNGLFMTDDGRAFFSTADPLVPQDTDGIRDVYEYVDGRAQLISSGTGSRELGIIVLGISGGINRSGLVGVSANGTDVYFSTLDNLVAKDHNGGGFLKFYDARTGGGFSEPPAAAPCAAADECAGPGSTAAGASQNGTGAGLGTFGNIDRESSAHPKKKHQKRHHRRKHHRRGSNADRGVRK